MGEISYLGGRHCRHGVGGAGCTSQPGVQVQGTLAVTVINAGGPALPDGGTRQVPSSGAAVRVAPVGGGAAETGHTDRAGVADFLLSAGSYSVSSPTCGSETAITVTVRASRSTPLTWMCPVP